MTWSLSAIVVGSDSLQLTVAESIYRLATVMSDALKLFKSQPISQHRYDKQNRMLYLIYTVILLEVKQCM